MKTRNHMSMSGLLDLARQGFDEVEGGYSRKALISLSDCLMSGLAIFSLKYPSLLQFDQDARDDNNPVQYNLKALYGMKNIPCDTYMRERLDKVDPKDLQRSFDNIISQLQRGKVLETYQYLKGYHLVLIDGTGCFSSQKVHCSSCCEKKHQDGSITYYHQMLTAVMAHPLYKTVFPLAVEPIQKQDGATKNDCEHTAAKRLLQALRSHHPHLKMIVVLDGLYADGPMIDLLRQLDMRFIITAKKTDLKYLFEFYRAATHESLTYSKENYKYLTHIAHGLPLNEKRSDLAVNFLEHFESGPKKTQRFCWITDLALKPKTIQLIAEGGRARWKIENETFNTLKNQGYQFEHNFGHGNENLSTVLASLMFLAFLIDQVQQFCCNHFKAALKRLETRIRLWEKIRGIFFSFLVDRWEDVYEVLGNPKKNLRLSDLIDSS